MSETLLKPDETGVAETSEHTLPSKPLLTAQMMAYRGTVPPPEMVRAYEEILPGSTNRFLQVAEREQQRRIDNDHAEVSFARGQEENAKSNYRWALVCSCILMVFYLIIMLICVLVKAPTQFLTAMLGVPALSTFAYIVALFINPKTTEKSEQNPTTRRQIEGKSESI
jgi:uncharacterized membrane protein